MAEKESQARTASLLNWFAPAAACALAILLLLGAAGFRGGSGAHRSRAAADASLASANARNPVELAGFGPAFAFSSADLNLQWNICSKASFEWTNLTQSPSSKDSLPFTKTNHLML